MKARLLFVHALSPLHAGTGQGVGVIDLPVAREKATALPFLPGSSVKGTLRDSCADEDKRTRVFGPDTRNASEYAGSVQFTDQRLLLLPVRSLMGTFAWVTSPYVLRRFARDAREVGLQGLPASVPAPSKEGNCLISGDRCAIKFEGDSIYLEDLDLTAELVKPDDAASQWARLLASLIFPGDDEWQSMLIERFCIVHDDIFSFLLTTATELTARVRLQEDAKTVAKGALWYEEALPAETLLYGLVVATPIRANDEQEVLDLIEELASRTLQFGGKATVGRGLCRIQLAG
jgi:CRISPR-associated protein Cmr4